MLVLSKQIFGLTPCYNGRSIDCSCCIKNSSRTTAGGGVLVLSKQVFGVTPCYNAIM